MQIDEITPSGRFTKAQLDLLKMFSREMPDSVWEEVRDILSNYFMQKATGGMDALFEENGWTEEKIQEWSKEHMRTPYK